MQHPKDSRTKQLAKGRCRAELGAAVHLDVHWAGHLLFIWCARVPWVLESLCVCPVPPAAKPYDGWCLLSCAGRHNSKLRIAAGVARGTGTGRVSDGVELTESKGLLARGGAGAAGDAGDEEGGAAAAEGSGRTANIGEGGDREDGEGEIVHRAVGGRRRAGGGGDNNAEEDDWSSGVVAGGGAAGGRGFALAGGRGR